MIKSEAYFILSPKPIIYIVSNNRLRGMYWESEYKAASRGKNAKCASQAWPTSFSFLFTDGLQEEVVRPQGDQLELSGAGLMQLISIHGSKNNVTDIVPHKVLKNYIEGNSLNNALRYLVEVVSRLAGRADKGGAMATYSVAMERAERGQFWTDMIGDCEYRDNLPKPS